MKFCRRGHAKREGERKCRPCQLIYTQHKRGPASADHELTPDWYDYVAVERALAGRPVGRALTSRERREYLRRTLDNDATD